MSQENNPSAEVVRRQQERDYEISQTILFERNAAALFRHYEKWKDIPQCYFIKLRLNLGYYNTGGLAMWMARPPYWLGTIVRNSIEHPDLFGAKCTCGCQAYAYRYAGSPLSGRVGLQVACPGCGRTWSVDERGWKVRSDVLQATQSEDKRFVKLLEEEGVDYKIADIRELLRYIGVPESELVLPEVRDTVERTVGPNGEVTILDPYGGAVIITKDTIHYRGWDGPSGIVQREIDLMGEKKDEEENGHED